MPLIPKEMHDVATEVARLLELRNRRIVFAESCTAGMIASTLAWTPGISRFFCGSAVVYQTQTKHEWLGIPESLLEDPGPVSREVATEMAVRVLESTPQADIAVSVTGHLGPDAPPDQDGLIYVGVAQRPNVREVDVKQMHLPADPTESPLTNRLTRQQYATAIVLGTVIVTLQKG